MVGTARCAVRGCRNAATLPQREIGINFLGYLRFEPILQSQRRSERNHRRIIRAQPGLCTLEFKSSLLAGVAKLSSQFFIATDAAAHRDKSDVVLLRGRDCLAHKDIDNRLLKRRAEISKQFRL